MDRKTQLTMFIPEIMNSWNNYKKAFKGQKITDWCISSDYCFGDPDKQNVATFTIFPANCISMLLKEVQNNLPHDIKQTTEFSEKELNFLKSNKYCFSIAFTINGMEYAFNRDVAVNHCKKLLEIKMEELPYEINESDFKKIRKQLQEFLNALQKKSFSLKKFAQIYFVAQAVSQIIEFLIIKENAKIIGWCSDRGLITSFVSGISYNLVQMYVHSFIKDRKTDYQLVAPPSENQKNIDFLIRIPDIITGALSSLITTPNGITAQKIKHQQLILNSIVNNQRIVSHVYNYDGKNKTYGQRMIFETLDKSRLFKFEREQMQKQLCNPISKNPSDRIVAPEGVKN